MWDLTLPGYRYLGPGNKLNKGDPKGVSDSAARTHDVGYDLIQKGGHNPYIRWSDADQRFIDEASSWDIGGFLGKQWFRKKKVLYNLGLLGKRVNVGRDKQDEAVKKIKGASGQPITLREWNKSKDPVSLPDSTSTTQAAMTDGDGSGNGGGNKETPIDNPYVVYRGPPDYTFASLPWIYEYSAQETDRFATDYIFRMTSPYDCRLETTTTDINVGVGTANVRTESESLQRPARWFNYYAGIYSYYHVVSCQYHVTIENMKTEHLHAYCMFYNETQPPTGATNHDMQLWRGVKYHRLTPFAAAVNTTSNSEKADFVGDDEYDEGMGTNPNSHPYETSNHIYHPGRSSCTFSGEYRPGQFRREIRLDNDVENWTAVTTNPSLPEKLLIRLKPDNEGINDNSLTTFGDDLTYRIKVNLNYLVEFKELKDGLRWPVERQPLTVTIAQSINTVG